MKTSKSDLIAYAMSFVSFVFPKIGGIKEIILFGSSARGEAGKESDIDIFFDIEDEKQEEIIKKVLEIELKKFYKSKIRETWMFQGIKNPISIKTGKLEDWKLKRSLISDGICLYSKYKEIPKGLEGFVYFNLNPIKNIAKRNSIIRRLFGRKEKNHLSAGLLEKINGKKFSPSSFIVKKEFVNNIIELLDKEKVSYKFFELWTDQVQM